MKIEVEGRPSVLPIIRKVKSCPIVTRVKIGHQEVVPTWPTNYIFDIEEIFVPHSLYFDDSSLLSARKTIDLRGWRLTSSSFRTTSRSCSTCTSLDLSNVLNLATVDFIKLRGLLPSLLKLSLRNSSIVVDSQCAATICSFNSLEDLDISRCVLNTSAFVMISQSCKNLRAISTVDPAGFDDYCLGLLSECIHRYRKLNIFDFSHASDITDIGLTAILSAGARYISSFNISGCKALNDLALVGLRGKMGVLEYLNISHNSNFSQTVFVWIGEGCNNLKHFNVSNTPGFTDESLISIGSNCHHLVDLNISSCFLISDYGIKGFIEKFTGKLKVLDISNNMECTGLTAQYLSQGADNLVDVKMNGMGSILVEGLQLFWAKAKNLKIFEMCANLKAAAGHRKSVLPHISDSVLMGCNYSHIITLKIRGAVLVTDVGVCDLVSKCKGLRTLDLGHCNKVTDVSLRALAATSHELREVDITMCVRVTDVGVRALCGGCVLLECLSLNGLSLSDRGLAAVPSLKLLQVLRVSQCSSVTDRIILRIAANCTFLRIVDLCGLDSITELSLKALAQHCPDITTLNCDSCDIKYHVYARIVSDMPLVSAASKICRVQSRCESIKIFNRHVTSVRRNVVHCKVLSRFCKLVCTYIRKREVEHSHMEAIRTISRVYGAYRKCKRIRAVKRTHVTMKRSANIIRKFFNRKWLEYMVTMRSRVRAAESVSAVLLQRIFRGHRGRTRANAKAVKRVRNLTRLRHFAWTAVMLYGARRVRAHVVKVQSHFRRCVGRLNYLCLLSAVRSLQRMFLRRFRIAAADKAVCAADEMRHQSVLYSAHVIVRNITARNHNRKIISFFLLCGLCVRTDYRNQVRAATLFQSLYRGHVIRILPSRGLFFLNGHYRGANVRVKNNSSKRVVICKDNYRRDVRWRGVVLFCLLGVEHGPYVPIHFYLDF